eukprot:COSAG06_NODE_9245_length_1947_cov_0.898864_2_plen_130_part_00
MRRVGQLVQTHMEDMEVSRHMAMVMVVAVVVFIVGDCARCGVMATSKDARLALINGQRPRLLGVLAAESSVRGRHVLGVLVWGSVATVADPALPYGHRLPVSPGHSIFSVVAIAREKSRKSKEMRPDDE